MKMSQLSLLAAILLGAISCRPMDSIPVIGLDKNNNPSQVLIPQKEYIRRISIATGSVEQSTLPALKKRNQDAPWLLRTVLVGIATNVQVGIGPFQVSALPRFRMIFTNSSNPTALP